MASLRALAFVLCISMCWGTGMRCYDHPLYQRGMKGEMIRAWTYAPRGGRQYWTVGTYMPRNERYNFVPIDGQDSNKYKGLDYFLTGFNGEDTPRFLTMHYQRPARTYLLVHMYDRSFSPVRIPGWKPEGWVKRSSGPPWLLHKFGLAQQKATIPVPYYAYVFSRTGPKEHVPSPKYLRRVIRCAPNVRASGLFSLLIGEADGSPVVAPKPPKGMKIQAGSFCPSELHDVWVAKGSDTSDKQTRKRMFKTWHPLWDSCYWCSYGHDHGSDASRLMGYTPRYGYTALKNNRQNEPHNGFKDFVIDVPRYRIYFGLHIQVSQARRFSERHHTLVIAVVEKKSRDLVLEHRFKADYGALVVRAAAGGLLGATSSDEKLRRSYGYKRQHRLINIINPSSLDPRWRYRKIKSRLLRGEYEQWATKPMCSAISNAKEPTVDVKDPVLAKRFAVGRGVTYLGRLNGNKEFVQHPGLDREFKAEGWTISDDLCTVRPPSEAYYTDVYGKELRDGPGPNNIRQFTKKGFKLNVHGRFETTDPWTGLYRKGAKGAFRNIGLGVKELEN